jgi:hypothetical protein
MRFLVHHHRQHDRGQQGERNRANQTPARALLDLERICLTHRQNLIRAGPP